MLLEKAESCYKQGLGLIPSHIGLLTAYSALCINDNRLLKAKQMLDYFKFNPSLFFQDGFKGNRVYAPYDRILVTCGAPEIPTALFEQLKIGGIMVIPVGEGVEQKMLRLQKIDDSNYSTEEFGTFKFVPMLERTVKSQSKN